MPCTSILDASETAILERWDLKVLWHLPIWASDRAPVGHLVRPHHRRGCLEDLRRLPHRAVTAVRVDNNAEASLAFERIRIPANQLALYFAKDGRFWTESVDFVRKEDTEFAELTTTEGAPAIDPNANRVAGPRIPHENIVVRAFSSLMK